ncbi:MAG TPA: hypothetical protein DCO82_08380 [Alphaproteobacteria bacterium]|nr:hypothetical protein [Alphaproteobacteria bacterium]
MTYGRQIGEITAGIVRRIAAKGSNRANGGDWRTEQGNPPVKTQRPPAAKLEAFTGHGVIHAVRRPE